MRDIGLIWAQTPEGVIGLDNTVPWHVPEDMAHFKSVTSGHVVIMGRKTWDSLPARFRPLPDRRNLVVTRDVGWSAEGAERAESVSSALAATEPDEAWVVGGGEIYRAAMPYATVISVTEIDVDTAGDTYAPPIGPDFILAATSGYMRSTTGISYRYRSYARVAPE